MIKKTIVKVLQGNYGNGWNDLVEYESNDQEQIIDDFVAYRENEPQYMHRIITRTKEETN